MPAWLPSCLCYGMAGGAGEERRWDYPTARSARQRNDRAFARMQSELELGLVIPHSPWHRHTRADAQINAREESARDRHLVFTDIAGVRIEREKIAVSKAVFAQHQLERVPPASSRPFA